MSVQSVPTSHEVQQQENQKKSRQGKGRRGNGQGGYMAVLHKLEEQIYGPETNDLTGSAMKILLYFRHRALRDWTKRKKIPKSEIMKATGLSLQEVKRAIKSLEEKKFILVTRTRVGKVWEDNAYELHPERFGTDYVWRPEKPTFHVIYGSKGHKSNQVKPAPSAETQDEVGSEMNREGGSEVNLGVGSQVNLGNAPKDTKSLIKTPAKNLLKEPNKKLFAEKVDWIRGGGEDMSSEQIQKRREFLHQQLQEIERRRQTSH